MLIRLTTLAPYMPEYEHTITFKLYEQLEANGYYTYWNVPGVMCYIICLTMMRSARWS